MAEQSRLQWAAMRGKGVPYLPIVTRGFDVSLRCSLDEPFPWKKLEYPYCQIVVDNTPDVFQKLLADAKEFAKDSPINAVVINCWNEYTEGSYLMPDARDGDASLRAIASVFGRKPAGKYVYIDAATRKFMEIPSATFENVPYGGHYKNKLDVWLPKNANAKTPVVIYFHGGGWTGGAMEDRIIGGAIEDLLANNIAVVCAQYRYIQDADEQEVYPPVKAPLDDAVRAVEFVKSNAQKWNIDTSKIALSGGSAGAYSAIYAALFGGCKLDVNTVAAYVPQTSLDPKQMREWIPNIKYGAHAFGFNSFDNWLAKRDELMPLIEKYSIASILEKCGGGKAPTFILAYPQQEKAGDKPKDPTHSMLFGLMFQDICKKKNISCDVIKSGHKQLFDLAAEKLKK